jgi:hypothetical protein
VAVLGARGLLDLLRVEAWLKIGLVLRDIWICVVIERDAGFVSLVHRFMSLVVNVGVVLRPLVLIAWHLLHLSGVIWPRAHAAEMWIRSRPKLVLVVLSLVVGHSSRGYIHSGMREGLIVSLHGVAQVLWPWILRVCEVAGKVAALLVCGWRLILGWPQLVKVELWDERWLLLDV